MKTKRIIALSLSIVMLLCSVISVSAVGTDSNVPSGEAGLNDGSTVTNALIASYDFEGSNMKERLTDKSAGTTGYNDYFERGRDSSVSMDDAVYPNYGVLSVFGTHASNRARLHDGSTYAIGSQSEFKQLGTELTVYTRVKFSLPEGTSDPGTNYHDVIALGSSSSSYADHFRLVITKYDAQNKTVNLTARVDGNDGSHAVTVTVPYDSFFNVAVSYSLTNDQKVQATLYLSTDDGKTWSVSTLSASATHAILSGVGYLQLGGGKWGYTVTFDDLKFYNKALSAKQIKLQSAGAMLHGVQTTEKDTTNNTVDIRFVASIDSTKYSAVGFDISAENGAKKWNDTADSVYSKLIGTKTENGTQVVEEYTAANIRGGATPYLYALCIEGVPASGTVTFIVKPYYIALDSTTPEYGVAYEITFTDGAFVSATVYTESAT